MPCVSLSAHRDTVSCSRGQFQSLLTSRSLRLGGDYLECGSPGYITPFESYTNDFKSGSIVCGYLAGCLLFKSQCQDWLALCQCDVTG